MDTAILNPRQRVVKGAFEAIANEANQVVTLGVEIEQAKITHAELQSFFESIRPVMGKTSHDTLVYAYRRCTESLERLQENIKQRSSHL